MMLTPYKLHILLDVYCGNGNAASYHAPIYDQTMADLVADGLCRPIPPEEARPIGREFDRTEKLEVLIEHIMKLPQPEWRMPC